MKTSTKRTVCLFSMAIAGCTGAGSGIDVPLQVAVSPATQALVQAPGGGGLTIQRARLLLNAVEFHGCKGAMSMMGPGKIEKGPYVIELAGTPATPAATEFALVDAAATGTAPATVSIAISDVPAATYRGSELEFEALDFEQDNEGRDAGDRDSSPATFDDFRDKTSNVIVEGTFGGAPFVFRTLIDAEQHSDVELVVTADAPPTLALALDLAGWFVDATTGAPLDPADPANVEAITANAERALEVGGHGHPKGHGMGPMKGPKGETKPNDEPGKP